MIGAKKPQRKLDNSEAQPIGLRARVKRHQLFRYERSQDIEAGRCVRVGGTGNRSDSRGNALPGQMPQDQQRMHHRADTACIVQRIVITHW